MAAAKRVIIPAEGFMTFESADIGHDLIEIETRGVIAHEPGGSVEGYQLRLKIVQRETAVSQPATIWTPWLFAPRAVVEHLVRHLQRELKKRPAPRGGLVQ